MTGGSVMRRINGERFGRWSLGLDACYCTVLIVLAVVTVAIDIALFATSQAVALRTLPARVT
ncbi:hypothetical protein [Actinomyces oricola]